MKIEFEIPEIPKVAWEKVIYLALVLYVSMEWGWWLHKPTSSTRTEGWLSAPPLIPKGKYFSTGIIVAR